MIYANPKIHRVCVYVMISPFLSNRKRKTDSLVWDLLHGIYRLSVHRLRPSLCLQTGWMLTIRYGSSDLMYKPCKPLKIVVQTNRDNRTCWQRHALNGHVIRDVRDKYGALTRFYNDTHAEFSTFNVLVHLDRFVSRLDYAFPCVPLWTEVLSY